MDSDSYTSQLIAGVTGGTAPALDNKDAGLHSQLVRARFSSTVPPTTANLLGAGTVRPAPGSAKSTDSYAGSAALMTEYNVGEVERQYYIEREGLGEPEVPPLLPPTSLQINAGTRTLTFVASAGNPDGVTHVAYARKVGTTAFVRLRTVVAAGTVLAVSDGLFAQQDLFVRAELDDRVSAYSAPLRYIYIPAPLTLSATVGPGTRQVTLTIGSSAADPADLVTSTINITYTSIAGTAALTDRSITPISGGTTTTYVITLGNANEEYTITVAGVGAWGVAAESAAVVVTPRVAPQLGTASLTLQVDGAALSLGALAVDAANPLLGAGNIRVIFRRNGTVTAPITTAGTTTASGGIISIVRTSVPGLAAGVAYEVAVQPLASHLDGPEAIVSAAFTFGLPMNIVSSSVTATAVPPTGTLRLEWAAAGTYDTSAPITGYRITRVSTGAAPVTVGVTTTADIGGLTPGVPVTFQIIAVNANGVSPVAATVTGTALTYSQPPAPSPGGYDVFQLDSTFAFKIAAVQGTTEQPVEGYRVFSGTTLVCTVPQPAVADLAGKTIFVKVRSGAAAEAAATAEYQASYNAVPAGQRIEAASQVFAAGFVLGTSYGFRIAPYNFVGEAAGITVGPKICITTPARTVTGLAAYSSPSGFYKLTWTAGGSVGAGAPVDRYVLYIGGVKQGLEVAASATVWTGLTLTAGAEVAVAAENLIGIGALPTAVTVPVATSETAVTGLAATVRYESLEVSWDAKATTWGLATTGYTVTLLDGASQPVTTRDIAAGTQATTFAVTLGAQYSVRLVAKNTLAEDTPVATAGPYTISSAGPTITAVTGSSHTIVVDWTQVATAWGAAVTGYRVYTSVNGAAATLAATVTGAGVLTATLTGLQNLVTVVVSVAAVNAAGQETTRTAWATPVTLTARIPELEGFSAVGGLGSGLLRLTVPSEKAATNPDGLTGTATYDLTCTPAVAGLPAQLTLGAAGTTYDLTGFANGTTYTLGLRRTYTDVAPWSADTYKTGYVSTEAAAFAPLALTLTSAVVAGTPLTARVGWNLGATPVPPAGTYYRVIRVTGPAPANAVTYVSAGSASAAALAGTQDIGGLTAGSNSFSVAITRVALAGADVPAAVWTAAGTTTLVVQDVPSAPVMTNSLTFDAAGNATDTLTATGTATAPRPITQVKIYEVSTPADLLLGTFTGVSVGSVPYTYALASLGTTKSFYAVATNTVGDSARGELSVPVTGSPPYAPREATGVSVTASTISGAGATATVGWTKGEPNATYFPVSGFRVEVLRSAVWTLLATYDATATTSSALDVTTDVAAATTIQLRVVQTGAGGSSAGVQVSRTYTKPTLGTVAVSATSVDKVITIPWTYTGDLAAVTALGLAITLPGGGTFTEDIIPSAATGTYTYTAAAYGVHGVSLTPRNVFSSGTAATASVTTSQPAPSTPVLASAVGGIEELTVTFSVASTDFVAGYTVDVGGVQTNVAGSPATIAAAAGTFAVRVRSYNSDGVASAWSNSIVATVSLTAPVLTSAVGGIESVSVSFTAASTTYIAGYTVDVSGVLTNVTGSPATIAAAPGTRSVRVRSYTSSGIVSTWSDSIVATVGLTAPVLTSAVGGIESVSVSFTAASTTYIAGYTVDVSGVLTDVSGSPVTIAAVPGTLSVRVRSYTSSGIVSTWSDSIVATVQPPVTPVPTLSSAMGGPEFINLTFTATPTTWIAGYTVDVSGVTTNVSGSPASVAARPGTYAVRVRSFNSNNVPSAYSNPITVTVTLGVQTRYKSIATGETHTLELQAAGTIRSWGSGASGQLGDGTTTAIQRSPVAVSGLSNCIAVSAGTGISAALLSDGTVRTWGADSAGQLGDGAPLANQSNPVNVSGLSNCVAIECGRTHMAALIADGTVRTWGDGANGRLGNGDTANQSTPVVATGVSNCIAIACGLSNTAVLIADGTVRTWGNNQYGQLGYNVGSNIAANVSTAVTPCNISNCVAIACGQFHMIALLADGTVRNWGRGDNGRLGIGADSASRVSPVTPCNISNAVGVTCGHSWSGALIADGKGYMWGFGDQGQLGHGTATTSQGTPVMVAGISTCMSLVGGGAHSAALLADGTMRTWGQASEGQLGNGVSQTNSVTLVTPTNSSNVAIVRPTFKVSEVQIYNSVSLSYTLADISRCYQPGTIPARGIAIVGATGSWEVTTNSGSTWSALGVVSEVSAVTLQGDPAVRLRSTAPSTDTLTVKAWSEQQATPALRTNGVNTKVSTATIEGVSFSTATLTMRNSPQPVPPVPTLNGALGGPLRLDISFSVSSTAFVSGYTVDVGGTTYDVSSSSLTLFPLPGTYAVRVRSFNVANVSSAYSSSITATVYIPVPITYRSIACGLNNTTALLTDSTMRIWGAGIQGQLGDTTTSNVSNPVPPTGVSNIIGVSCGENHTAVLLADGTVRTWGRGTEGQLGYNLNQQRTTSVTPCNISNCVAIVCGQNNTAALLADGTMRTWGAGGSGQLGNGSNVNVSNPVQPTGISTCIAIGAGSAHTIALLADGTVRTWGAGANGQLGNNSTANVSNAVTPCNLSNCVSIAAGLNHNAALLADGTVRTWGLGTTGQLGNDSNVTVSNAVTVCNVSNCVAIACGGAHTAALLADGTMQTWGDGGDGRLGNGVSGGTVSNAITLCNISNVVAIACGAGHTAALLADGTMRTWGAGGSGQLGNNSLVSVSNPVMPSDISNVAIVVPSFKLASVPIFRDYPLSEALLDISTAYQPGIVLARGIAITGAVGSWQISTNSGTTWSALGAVSSTSAVALRGNPAVRLRATNFGTDALTVKAWSTQQATPAVLTTGVNTTLSDATIQGYSFAAAGTQMVLTVKPAPVAAPVLFTAIGGEGQLTVTFDVSSTRFIAGYTVDVSGVLTSVSGSPATITAAPGSWSVRVRADNGDGLSSAWSDSIVATVQLPTPPVPVLIGALGGAEFIDLSFTATPTTYIAGYTVDMGGTTFTIFSSPATVPALPGTYAVRVRSFNASNVPSAYSNEITVTVVLGAPKTYTSIAGGANHTAALLADGTMQIWGSGGSGQLGNGTTVSVSTAVIPTGISNCIAITCGGNHTAALIADGTMRIWGNGVNGQLGIGLSNISVSNAVTPTGISNCVAISCGGITTAILLVDGTMRTWGAGNNGRLGNGSTADQTSAVTPTGVSNVIAISCGAAHTAALLIDGTIRIWGLGDSGQLGNSSTASQTTAVTPTGVSNVVAISCGGSHTAALLADGTMRTWGAGSNGQLGNSTTTATQTTAVTPTSVSNVVAIACGYLHTAALLADGTMRAWGRSAEGQLGISLTTNQTTAVTPTSVSNVVGIACGTSHTAALLADGTMRTWGRGIEGQLGNGSNVTVSNAVIPTGVSNVAIVPPKFKVATVPIFKDYPLSAALLDISTAYQPGSGAARGIAITGATGSWQVSTNSGSTWSALGAVSPSSAVALRGSSAVQLRATNYGTDALTVKAWSTQQATPAVLTTGVNTTLGGASIQGYSFAVAEAQMVLTARPAPAVPVLASAVGGLALITVTFSVTPTTWVAGYTVDVGGVLTNVASSPATIAAAPGTVAVRVCAYNVDGVASAYSNEIQAVVSLGVSKVYTSIGTGQDHMLAISGQTLNVWGSYGNGQLGNNTFNANQTTAITLIGFTNCIAVAGGISFSAALFEDGTVKTWGRGDVGQLGDPNRISLYNVTPVTVSGITNCVSIACGHQFMTALLADGTVRAWGSNAYGTLGSIGGSYSASQVQVSNISNCVAIACGESHAIAILANGTMVSWGKNTVGQLGRGTATAFESAAAAVSSISNVVAIACGNAHSLALLANGTMRAWGSNANYKLGISNLADQSSPVAVSNISNAVGVACGHSFSAALLANGTTRMWGYGGEGQLGNNTTTFSQLIPVTPIYATSTTVSTCVSIVCGGSHTAVLLADGTMRTWGYNNVGQLGNNSTINSSTAVTVSNTTGISIIKPSFKNNLTISLNTVLTNLYFFSTDAGYQPGTVPFRGIAVTATTGTWQYSTNSGTNWNTISGVTATTALALRLEPTVRIKCIGSVGDVLTVKAWSGMQDTPVTVTTGVDATISSGSIYGYSFAAATTTITAA